MRKQSIPEFVNSQVRLLIKKYPDRTIRELVEIANIEFPVFKWNYDKIRNAVTRINKSDNVNIIKKDCIEYDNSVRWNRPKLKKRLRMLIVNDTI
jgi:hypothetical protein